jgi:hypothetical protein
LAEFVGDLGDKSTNIKTKNSFEKMMATTDGTTLSQKDIEFIRNSNLYSFEEL